MRLKLIHLLPLASLLAGCGRASVNSDIRADGSWTRTVKLAMPGEEKPNEGIQLGPTKLEDIFILPSGAEWKVKKEKKKEETVFTAERTIPLGMLLRDDIVIKGGAPAPNGKLLINMAAVRKLPDGRLEYRETLHWQGSRPKELDSAVNDLGGMIKAALPAGVATDADVKMLSQPILREFWHMLFGPADPMISQLMMHPDLVERKMKRRIGQMVIGLLKEKLGDKLTDAQREAAAAKLVQGLIEQGQGASQAKAKAGPADPNGKNDMDSLVAMLFVVHTPGRITDTNGERDDAAREVYWALYPQAAAIEDITLTATSEPGH